MAFQVINQSNYVEIKNPTSGLRKTFSKGSHRLDLINDVIHVINEESGESVFQLRDKVTSITDNVAGTTPTPPTTISGLIDTLAGFFFRELGEIYDIGALTDGAAITLDAKKRSRAKASLTTTQSFITLSVTSLGEVFDLFVKKNTSENTTLAVEGSSYEFVDLGSKDTPATGVSFTLSGTSGNFFKLTLDHSGINTASDNAVVLGEAK